MGGLFGSSNPAPILPAEPARPAPTPLNDTGSKVVLGSDALARLNERASGEAKKKSKKTTKASTTGLGSLGGDGPAGQLTNFV